MALTDDLDRNLSTVLRTLADQAARGTQLLLFPETMLTGYSPEIGHPRTQDEWPRIQAALDRVAGAAREAGLWAVVGSEALDQGQWVNRLYAYSRRGECVATYDKVSLTGADEGYSQFGTRHTVFDLDGVAVGLQICYDIRFPKGYRALLAQGAEVILQGFCARKSATWKVPVMEAHLRSRAAENGCFLVAANAAGPLQMIVSEIVDPAGLVLARANQDCEEVITAELDLSRVAESEIRRHYLARSGVG